MKVVASGERTPGSGLNPQYSICGSRPSPLTSRSQSPTRCWTSLDSAAGMWIATWPACSGDEPGVQRDALRGTQPDPVHVPSVEAAEAGGRRDRGRLAPRREVDHLDWLTLDGVGQLSSIRRKGCAERASLADEAESAGRRQYAVPAVRGLPLAVLTGDEPAAGDAAECPCDLRFGGGGQGDRDGAVVEVAAGHIRHARRVAAAEFGEPWLDLGQRSLVDRPARGVDRHQLAGPDDAGDLLIRLVLAHDRAGDPDRGRQGDDQPGRRDPHGHSLPADECPPWSAPAGVLGVS